MQLESLVAQGHRIQVLTVAHEGRTHRANVNGVDVIYFRTAFRSGSPRVKKRSLISRVGWQFGGLLRIGFLWGFYRAARKLKPDAVYVNNLAGLSRAVVICSYALGIPIVAALRDYSWICVRQSMFRKGRSCSARCQLCRVACAPRALAFQMIQGVVANSAEVLKQHSSAGIVRRKLTEVIYAGAPPMSSGSRPAPEARLRIGVMGQLQATKGFDRFFRDVAALAVGGRLRVVVAGEIGTPFGRALVSEWAQPWVEFRGKMDRDAFFDSVDVVVIPSEWREPLSRIVYEAFARGVCVIASRHGGQKEVIRHGENGMVYVPGDGSLAGCLEKLLADRNLVKRLGEQARVDASRYVPASAAASLARFVNRVRAES